MTHKDGISRGPYYKSLYLPNVVNTIT